MTIFDQLRAGVKTTSPEQMRALAAQLAQSLPADSTLALHGNLGVGKTTFVQGLAQGFGVTEPVTSPTFNIYTVHRSRVDTSAQITKRPTTLVHLDAYRLEDSDEIENLLLEDFLVTPWCLAIEWPDKIAEWLPPQSMHLSLGITPDQAHTIRLL